MLRIHLRSVIIPWFSVYSVGRILFAPIVGRILFAPIVGRILFAPIVRRIFFAPIVRRSKSRRRIHPKRSAALRMIRSVTSHPMQGSVTDCPQFIAA